MAIDLRNKLECNYLDDSPSWEKNLGQSLDRVAVKLDSHPSDELNRKAQSYSMRIMGDPAAWEICMRVSKSTWLVKSAMPGLASG